MKRKVAISVGEYYHIYNHGIENRDVFVNSSDYRRFMLLLNIFNKDKPIHVRDFKQKLFSQNETLKDTETLVDIGAFCLMPNHFHILLKEKRKSGITDFIHKLSTGYTMYFNKKYRRAGPLFQGTFKIEHAHSDEYVKYLFSHIHLNPLEIIDDNWKDRGFKDILSAQSFLDTYHYSSYLDYRNPKKFNSDTLCRDLFSEHFLSSADFDRHIFDWMGYETDE